MKKQSTRGFIILIAVLFLIFIAAIYYATKGTREIVQFSTEPSEVLSESLKTENFISPIKVAKSIINKDSSIVLVDIRSQFEYIKGHLPNAINIYKADVLDKENFDFFQNLKTNNKKAIIYGDDIVEANVPYMILKQTGIENILLLKCGYKFFNTGKLSEIAEMGDLDLDNEVAALDFAKMISNEKTKSDNLAKQEEAKRKAAQLKTKSPVKKHKKKVIVKKKAAPSPAPIEEEEEEDEGC